MRRRRRAVMLVGSRLTLRPFRSSDVSANYLRWLNDPAVNRYLEVGTQHQTTATAREYLKRFQRSNTDRMFAIIHRTSGQSIGTVTINRVHRIHKTAETGLMIGRKECWRQGYALEAWRLVLDYAFTVLGVRKMIAGAVAENHASIATLEKLGFEHEGRFRREFVVDGVCHDVVRLGLQREEWAKARGRIAS